jgi:hypothetical protein
MDSKFTSFKIARLLALFSLALLAAACSGRSSNSDAFLVGEKVRVTTSALNRNGEQVAKIAVFDRNVGRIHQFDTATLALLKSVSVLNPSEPHFVYYSEQGDYIVDLSKKHLSIISAAGTVQNDPIRFTGVPISTIFHQLLPPAAPAPGFHLAVIYDDRNSVGMLQLTTEGRVVDSWVGGSMVSEDKTIYAGDMTDDGRLILALGNNTLAIVNTMDAIAQKQWPNSKILFTHALTNLKWIAAVRGQPNLILAAGSQQVALIDLNLQAVVGTPIDLAGRGVEAYSKMVDPHIILSGKPYTLIYVKAGVLASRDVLPNASAHVLRSTLNVLKQTWSFIDYEGWLEFTDGVEVQKSTRHRMMSSYDFTNMRNTDNRLLSDVPNVELMKNGAFGFYLDSRLGHAAVFAPEGGVDQEIRAFNLPYLSR